MYSRTLVLVGVVGAFGLSQACSASTDKDTNLDPGQTPDGGIGGRLDDGLRADGSGTGILGDPRTCDEAAAVKAYVGCDFWPTVVGNNVWSIFDFAVIVANAGEDAADITVTGPGGVKETTSVPPGQLSKIFLPWVKDLKGPDTDTCGVATPLPGSVRSNRGAYHLVASRPVTVYQFNALEYKGAGGKPGKSWAACPGSQPCKSSGKPVGCFSFSNDASLLLPSTAMTGTYRVTGVSGWSSKSPFGGETPVLGAYVAITATQDGTTVTMKVGATGNVLAGGGIPATGPGGTVTATLAAGDVIELVGDAKTTSDLSGSLITANKPIQVIAGVPCIQSPIGTQACDHVEESVFPAETLGKDYIVTVPTGPNGNIVGHVVKLYGNVDGTNLTYFPSKPPGAPNSLNAGQVVDLGKVAADFRVTGDQSFAVGSFMLGGQLLDPGSGTGDPSLSFTTAIEQYRRRYVFLAPDDYDVSYVDIVYPEGATLRLDGVEPPAGKTVSPGFLVSRAKLGAGKSGAHSIEASKPVGVQVMGYGSYTSYQYPGGLDLKSIAPPPVK